MTTKEATVGENRVLLFQGFEPDLHKRVPETVRKYDFVLVGSTSPHIYEKRNQAIELLSDKFSYFYQGKGFEPSSYNELLNQARVQFVRSMHGENGEDEMAQRFFECLAIGPLLHNYVPNMEQSGLIEGVDFFSYKNDKEMVDKMQYLLDNSDFANKMANNGRKKALILHTFEHRLLTILNHAFLK